MKLVRLLLRIIDRVNQLVARVVCWAVVLIMAATVYEVVMRYVFGAPTSWVFEFNYLLHGAYFMLMGGYVLAVRGHVNVDLFYGRTTDRRRAIIDCLTAPVFFFFIGMLLYYGTKFAVKSWAVRETLSSAWAPAIYPVKTAIPVAASLILLQGLAKFVRDLHLAVTGREVDQ